VGSKKLDATISVLDATRQMKCQGELVLRAWANEDPEMQGLSLSQLAGRIYSRMAGLHPALPQIEYVATNPQDQKIAFRLKSRIRQA
jgi:hypothetical protein